MSASADWLARTNRVDYDERYLPDKPVLPMAQVLAATFEGGVFKPDERPTLLDNSRVRLVVEPLDANEQALADESWNALQQLWRSSSFRSPDGRLNRDQLHERH